MSIPDYDTLKAAVADFLNRDDMTAMIANFVQFAEAGFNRNIRHWRMETVTTFTGNAQFEDLPADWIETVRVDVSGGPRLKLVSRAEMQALREHSEDTAGEPTHYALIGGQIELYPTPDGDYTLNHVYVAEIAALSDGNTTNWLLTAAPDLYVYAALLHSAPYLIEDQRLAVWGTLRDKAMLELQNAGNAAKTSGTMRVTTR